jgi:hypothetical protein
MKPDEFLPKNELEPGMIIKLEPEVFPLHPLLEKKSAALGNDFDAINYLNMILRDCNQVLPFINKAGHFLCHGNKKFKSDAGVGLPFNNRKPKDSTRKQQNVVDNMLQKAGFTALRGNSIFTANKLMASDYGVLYMIFPFDGFQYTWSTRYGDLYADYTENVGFDELDFTTVTGSASSILNKAANALMPIKSELGHIRITDKYNHEQFKKHESEFRMLYKMEDQARKLDLTLIYKPTKAAVKSALVPFIMTYKEYTEKFSDGLIRFSISPSRLEDFRAVWEWMSASKRSELSKEEAQLIAEKHGFTNTDLDKAIEKNREIYLRGKFYVFNYERFVKPFRKVLIAARQT